MTQDQITVFAIFAIVFGFFSEGGSAMTLWPFQP
jgi:hypothetical protein